jgi:hypothetical protein
VKADLSRKTFDPLNHFSRVLMQQGRVQLDADWNEQAAILLHLIRRLTADVLGPVAAVGSGFEIGVLAAATTAINDVSIAPGDIYVDGILCELAATPVAILNWEKTVITVANWTVDRTSYAVGQYLLLSDDAQPTIAPVISAIVHVDSAAMALTMDQDFSKQPLNDAIQGRARRLTTYLTQPDLLPPPTALTGTQLLYLDVWERLITAAECDEIREVALNGPDTAARTRVVCQIKALPETQLCITQQQLMSELMPWDRGYLRARIQPAQGSTDPCTISPTSSYRGPENQLYRVEIHTGSGGAGVVATFKWSRENGAVVFPIVSISSAQGVTTAVLGNLGRDDRFGLAVGDYVEVQNDATVLGGQAGPLLQVQSIDSAMLSVVLSGTVLATFNAQPSVHPLLRRWDQQDGDPSQGGTPLAADNAVPIPAIGKTQTWIDLEDGVQVLFDGPPGPAYITGDYWLIPARVATGNVIWPTETVTDAQNNTVTNPVAKPPDGIDHHYAPLAIVTVGANNIPQVRNCCEGFRPVNTIKPT